jgi:hypothetical protein
MSTIKASNIQNGSSASVNIALNTDGSATFAQIPVPSSSFLRNRIINGAMVIDQRNAGASVNNGAGGLYTLDRWTTFGSQSAKFSIQQNAASVTPPAGFSNYLGVTSLSAYTVGASESFSVRQYIEGFNSADFNFGTANAATVTLSFWVRSSLTGNFGGCFYNGAGNRLYPFTYSISSASTWEYKTITIAGDTTGTWIGATNGIGLAVQFSLGAGASVSGTAGAWTASTALQPTGSTSVVGTNGATFYLTGVQLEVGSVATPFERRLINQELAMCQRYYYRNTVASLAAGWGANYSTTGGRVWSSLPVIMRATPTLVVEGTSFDRIGLGTATATIANQVASVSAITFDGTSMSPTSVTGQPLAYTGAYSVSAEL